MVVCQRQQQRGGDLQLTTQTDGKRERETERERDRENQIPIKRCEIRDRR